MLVAGVVLLCFLLTGCDDSDVEKAVRSDVESRSACAKPQELGSFLMKKLTAAGVLSCKNDNASECTAQSQFAASIRVRPQPGFLGMPTGPFAKIGPQEVLLCGQGKLAKILKQETRQQGSATVIDVTYEVKIEMNEAFKTSSQSKELAALFELRPSFTSAMTLVRNGNDWVRCAGLRC
jgi:hypothetical protein